MRVRAALEGGVSGTNDTSSRSIGFPDPPVTVVGSKEFLSPLGLQMTDQATGNRFKLVRDTGQVLGRLLSVDGAQHEWDVKEESGELRIYKNGGFHSVLAS